MPNNEFRKQYVLSNNGARIRVEVTHNGARLCRRYEWGSLESVRALMEGAFPASQGYGLAYYPVKARA